MRCMTLCATTRDLDPAAAYQRIRDFRSYAELTETVQEVRVQQQPDGSELSDWTVHFRNGLMRWRERDVYSPETLSITFKQLSGDFETFEGSWSCDVDEDGSTLITFNASFDLGIPTLAEILDPVAESTLRSNIALILHGLVGAEVAAVRVGAAHG
jgi:ribosome-associated toxin RatA of RatAB toxin-antitoxin module